MTLLLAPMEGLLDATLRDVLTRLPTQLNSRIGELLPHTWCP